METPSSTARRITRSQTASNNIPVSRKMNEDAENSVSKTQKQQQDRCALVDISNDSPIVGLAKGKEMDTPLSSMTKKKRAKTATTKSMTTPGSGEALLRGQVKTLLQKVEEEAVISKLSMEKVVPYNCFLKLVSSSPMSLLLAPTPANTPQVPNLSELPLVSPPSVVEEQLISRVVNEIFEGKNKESGDECEKSVISRSLLLDFSDKSEVSECSSEVTCEEVTQGSVVVSGITEDDGSSVWSIQVNASSMQDEDEDNEEMGEEEEEEEEEEDYYEDGDAEDVDGDFGGLSLDELCAGLNSISVNENKNKGCGKHTRFVYDSEDDEVVEKVVEECCAEENVMHLKGLPTPKGKHLRFPDEEQNSSDL